MSTMTLDSRRVDRTYDFLYDRGAFPAARRVRPTGRSSDRSVDTVRLTHRGRALILGVALLVAFVVGVFVSAAGSVASEHPGTPAPTRIVQVEEGDTLWQLASGLAAGGDVRSMMTTIEHLNALDTDDVYVGQRLVVPAG